MGPSRARLTLAAVEQIFRRRGWRYEVARGFIVTVFRDVPMLLGVDGQRGLVVVLAPVIPGRGMQGYTPTRPGAERDVVTFLAAINYRLALGGFVRDERDGEIVFGASSSATNNSLNDQQLAVLIATAVAAVTVFEPVIRALLAGRISLNQALSSLDNGNGGPPPTIV
jgi:Putative bacterial sensory transduction regulator